MNNPTLVWVSEYQWITPIGLSIKVPVNNPHWFEYQNTNEQSPLVWVSEYQWIIPIGLGIKIPMNNPHWLGIKVPMNNPHWFGYQNQFLVRLSIIIYMKSYFLTKIYLIQIHTHTHTHIYIYNHIFNIQIYLWYFYILYFKSI